jgi:hypothetical protein
MPLQKPCDPNERLGKTVGLLLRLCKSIYLRGVVVILDSGFCILQGIIELWKKVVFAAAVLEKGKYLPKYVGPGAAIDKKKWRRRGLVTMTHYLALLKEILMTCLL